MKILGFAPIVLLAVMAGCASTAAVPQGMKAGQFVDFACEGGKRLSARAGVDGSTIRVRFEGGWELDRKADGVYEADGWRFASSGGASALSHNGKVVASGCKPA